MHISGNTVDRTAANKVLHYFLRRLFSRFDISIEKYRFTSQFAVIYRGSAISRCPCIREHSRSEGCWRPVPAPRNRILDLFLLRGSGQLVRPPAGGAWYGTAQDVSGLHEQRTPPLHSLRRLRPRGCEFVVAAADVGGPGPSAPGIAEGPREIITSDVIDFSHRTKHSLPALPQTSGVRS